MKLAARLYGTSVAFEKRSRTKYSEDCMLKGIMLSLAIISVSAFIPILHFFAFPLSPFIAGYFGIQCTQIRKEKYAIKSILFGTWIGVLFLIPASLIGIMMMKVYGLGSHHAQIITVMVLVSGLYSGSMSTLGAMYSVLRRKED